MPYTWLVSKLIRGDRWIQALGQACGVAIDLQLNATHGVADGLGFQDAHRLAIHEEQVVGEAAVGETELPHGHAATGGEVHLIAVLDEPPGFDQVGVNLLPSSLLGGSGSW